MIEYRVKSFSELHTILSKYRKSNLWLFRGQSDANWELIPKAGRKPFSDCDDIAFFESWKRRALEFTQLEPRDDWDWIALAQHHGLATRLLDWTFNPLIGAYFSVAEESETDAHIFAYYSNQVISSSKISPIDYKGVIRVKPRSITQRITRQGGIFTLHEPPTLSLEKALRFKDKLEKIIIDKCYKKELLFELSYYGVNRLTLFPDLDGLSFHTNWHMSNKEYWVLTEKQNDI